MSMQPQKRQKPKITAGGCNMLVDQKFGQLLLPVFWEPMIDDSWWHPQREIYLPPCSICPMDFLSFIIIKISIY